ncbi:MAG: hypothetical protein NC347_00290 [Clostridium sp.]|nr:hypothetical protein [Clostridium sp.]
MVDKTTKNLINLYLEYSDHDKLTVKEFMVFRKEAVYECSQLQMYQTDKIHTDIKNNQEPNTTEKNAAVSSAAPVTDTIRDINSFNDENFLLMMKQIDD